MSKKKLAQGETGSFKIVTIKKDRTGHDRKAKEKLQNPEPMELARVIWICILVVLVSMMLQRAHQMGFPGTESAGHHTRRSWIFTSSCDLVFLYNLVVGIQS
jgi:hypothetical protein